MKQQEKRRITKGNFTTALFKLCREKEFTRISVKDICSCAGYHRSTFYEYYSDIYDLRDQTEDRLIASLTKIFTLSSTESLTAAFIHSFTRINEESGEILWYLLSENGDPHFAVKIKEALKPYYFKVFAIPPTDQDMEYVFDFAIMSGLSFYVSWYSKGKHFDADSAVALVRRVLVDGLATVIAEHSEKPDQVSMKFI